MALRRRIPLILASGVLTGLITEYLPIPRGLLLLDHPMDGMLLAGTVFGMLVLWPHLQPFWRAPLSSLWLLVAAMFSAQAATWSCYLFLMVLPGPATPLTPPDALTLAISFGSAGLIGAAVIAYAVARLKGVQTRSHYWRQMLCAGAVGGLLFGQIVINGPRIVAGDYELAAHIAGHTLWQLLTGIALTVGTSREPGTDGHWL